MVRAIRPQATIRKTSEKRAARVRHDVRQIELSLRVVWPQTRQRRAHERHVRGVDAGIDLPHRPLPIVAQVSLFADLDDLSAVVAQDAPVAERRVDLAGGERQPRLVRARLRHRRQIPRYHLRHKVKAGLTGWAQINGLRGQTSIEKRIAFDLYYIENWSLMLDLKILARTVAGGFLSKNAY